MALVSRVTAVALSVAAAGWFAPEPSLAQSSLREKFGANQGGRTGAPPVAKYVAGEDREFVFDRSGQTPLLKFEDSNEVWALRPSPGPGNDVIYRDDTGRPVLRATRLGGMTVFTPERPSGLPAALAGQASKLKPAAVTAVQLFRHFVRQSGRVSRALGRQVDFEAPEILPGQEQVYADAATVTADALTRVAPKMTRRGPLSRVRRVEFAQGSRAEAAVSGDAIRITVAPEQGPAGRPSSRRIITRIGAN